MASFTVLLKMRQPVFFLTTNILKIVKTRSDNDLNVEKQVPEIVKYVFHVFEFWILYTKTLSWKISNLYF